MLFEQNLTRIHLATNGVAHLFGFLEGLLQLGLLRLHVGDLRQEPGLALAALSLQGFQSLALVAEGGPLLVRCHAGLVQIVQATLKLLGG